MIDKYDFKYWIYNTLYILFGITIMSVGVWLAFWFVNGILYLNSLVPDFLGAISQQFSESGSPLVRATGYLLLDLVWFYGFALLGVFLYIKPEYDTIDSTMVWIYIIMTVLIIVVYDPRIAPLLPRFLEAPIVWLQTSCNARLVGFPSMFNDFSDKITDPVYYWTFDFVIAVSCLLAIAVGRYKNK